MAEYEYEDLLGGDAPPANPIPVDPVTQALATLRRLSQPVTPAAAVGNDLASRPLSPEAAGLRPVVDMSVPLSHPGFTGTPPGEGPGAASRPDFAVGVDRFGADRTATDTGQPYEAPNDYTPPAMPGSVDEATRVQNDQLSRAAAAQEAFGRKKFEAQQAHAVAQADAMEESVIEQGLLNTRQDRTVAMINARADAELAAHLKELDAKAKEEPNPARWWDNQSGLGKALWALSLVFGAAHTALTPGAKNAALEMVRQEISSDVARQDARLKRELDVLREKGSDIRERRTRNLSDSYQKYSREYSRIMAMERAWMVRATAPNDLDAQAMKLEAQGWFEQQKLGILGAYRQELVAARQAEAARSFQAAQAKLDRDFRSKQAADEREFQESQKALDRQLQRDLAQISVSAKGPRVNAQGLPVDEHGLPVLREVQSGPGTGLVLKDRTTGKMAGDGVIRVRDDKMMQEASEVRDKANARYTAMKKLRDLLADEGSMVEVAGVGVVNPQLNAQIQQLGYEIAKTHDPRVTNQDFSKGVEQAMGFDPNGDWLERGKFVGNRKEIIAKIDEDLANMPPHVSSQVNKFLDRGIVGTVEAVWDPSLLEAPKVPERPANQVEGRPNVTLEERPVTSAKDYSTRFRAEQADVNRRGQELPDHDPAAMRSLLEGVKGRGPAGVEAEARRILKSLDAREEAIRVRNEGADFPGGSVFNQRPLSESDERELRQVQTTRKMVESVAADEVSRAAQKLKRVEENIKALKKIELQSGRKWVTDDVVRNKAKELGLDRDPRAVDELVKKLRNIDITKN